MNDIIYTHKEIEFIWLGGLNICLKKKFIPLKLQLNNGSPSWRLNRKTWLSLNQLKEIITKRKTQTSYINEK